MIIFFNSIHAKIATSDIRVKTRELCPIGLRVIIRRAGHAHPTPKPHPAKTMRFIARVHTSWQFSKPLTCLLPARYIHVDHLNIFITLHSKHELPRLLADYNNTIVITLSFDIAPFPYKHVQRRKITIKIYHTGCNSNINDK